jgi:hypothetical protein
MQTNAIGEEISNLNAPGTITNGKMQNKNCV